MHSQRAGIASLALLVVAASAPTEALPRTTREPSPACSLDGVVLTVTLDPAAPPAVLRRDGQAIVLDGLPCAGALVTTVDTIRIGGAPSFVLDLRGGPFGPGVTPEDTGSAEIELEIATPALTVEGTSRGDLIAVGGDGMALNADGDADASFAQPPEATVDGRGGKDVIRGLGGFGATGS